MRRAILAALAALLLLATPAIAAGGLTLNGTPVYGATISYTFNDAGTRVLSHRCFVAEDRQFDEFYQRWFWLNPVQVSNDVLASGEPVALDDWAADEQFAFCDAEVFRVGQDGVWRGGRGYFQYPVPAG